LRGGDNPQFCDGSKAGRAGVVLLEWLPGGQLPGRYFHAEFHHFPTSRR